MFFFDGYQSRQRVTNYTDQNEFILLYFIHL